jgi:hypothetical protein
MDTPLSPPGTDEEMAPISPVEWQKLDVKKRQSTVAGIHNKLSTMLGVYYYVQLREACEKKGHELENLAVLIVQRDDPACLQEWRDRFKHVVMTVVMTRAELTDHLLAARVREADRLRRVSRDALRLPDLAEGEPPLTPEQEEMRLESAKAKSQAIEREAVMFDTAYTEVFGALKRDPPQDGLAGSPPRFWIVVCAYGAATATPGRSAPEDDLGAKKPGAPMVDIPKS